MPNSFDFIKFPQLFGDMQPDKKAHGDGACLVDEKAYTCGGSFVKEPKVCVRPVNIRSIRHAQSVWLCRKSRLAGLLLLPPIQLLTPIWTTG
jgi:hypothetical protein